jgi:hypothetical protein
MQPACQVKDMSHSVDGAIARFRASVNLAASKRG